MATVTTQFTIIDMYFANCAKSHHAAAPISVWRAIREYFL